MPRTRHPVDARSPLETRFAEVVRTYEAPLSRYLVRMVGDAEVARDLAQETFLSAWNAWPDSEPRHLSAWLYRIATNHALSHLRRRKVIRWVTFSQLGRRGDGREGDTDPATIDHLFPGAESPGESIAETDAIEAILDAMDPKDRATLLLHAAGFSGAEIGERLDGTPASARTRLSRARAQFRDRYARLASLAAIDRPATPETPPASPGVGPGRRLALLPRPDPGARPEPDRDHHDGDHDERPTRRTGETSA